MKVSLPGIAWATKRLADGTRRRYFYAWRGGPPLIGEPGTPEFIASYHAAYEARRNIHRDTLMHVIAAYKGSREFPTNERTRRDYLRCIATIEETLGTLPLRALEAPSINADFIKWRDGLSCSDRWKDYHFAVLKIVLNWGCNLGLCRWRPPSRVKKLYNADRSECIWLPSDVEAMRRACSQELAWALDLALWTGQRQGDLLKLSWTQVREGWLVLRQGKTKARVGIPLTGTFGAIIDGIPKRAVTILTNSRGLPWTESGFRASWSKAFNETSLSDLHFNDLRGTAVINLADAGCSIPEIASITGHKLKSVHGILERYWSPTQT